jgi:hypothetical protein
LLFSVVSSIVGAGLAEAAEKDPKAVALAERTMEAMGGREAFDAHPMLTFRFAVVREGTEVVNRFHAWDRYSGRYRLEYIDGEKNEYLALFNVNDRQGRVWRNDDELDGDERDQQLERAYGMYINDTYWLLMPWKWLDPGVNLAYEGEMERDGTTYEAVLLTFETGVGLTSGDRYWGLVSPETGLMERWEFVLQQEDGSPGEGEPAGFLWEEWAPAGEGLRFSRNKPRAGSDAIAIRFPLATLSKTVDESLFTIEESGAR